MACVRLLEFGGLAVTVVLGGGPLAAATAFVSGRTAGTLGMWIVLRRRSPWLSFGCTYASKRTIRRLATPAFAFMAFPLGNALNVQGILIVVGSMLGPIPTVVFNTLRTMTRAGLQLINAIRAAVAAEISAAFGAGDYVLLRQIHHRSCQAALWLSVALVSCLFVLGGKILSVWTHGRVEMDMPAFVLLLCVVLPSSVWLSSLNVVYATNRHERVGAAYVAVSFVTVFAAYALARTLQLPGVAAILLLGDLGMALYVLGTSLNLLKESPTDFARALVAVPGLSRRRSA